MILLVSFSFIAGFVTVLSPCILPLLPILLSGGMTGGKQRPTGIIIGFIASFTFFTLTIAAIVQQAAIPADYLRVAAIILLGVFGLFLAIPALKNFFETLVRPMMPSKVHAAGTQNGFVSGFLVGMSLGLVWTPCVGPILAAVITLAAAKTIGLESVLITLAYSVGTAIPMFLIMLGGRAISAKINVIKTNSALIQRVFGIVIILMAIALSLGVDKKFEVFILKTFPQYGQGLISIEDRPDVIKELEKISR